ncbi:unnamed protein product [Prorocentrum cordatum]|uniref:Uncharacterized protein n=1 Tax=Prorocentrum cordatum TaxID=2364126 RepID=A0ABN9UPD7_9DINO|nr:unnamed protein product [Polarella glacialis]
MCVNTAESKAFCTPKAGPRSSKLDFFKSPVGTEAQTDVQPRGERLAATALLRAIRSNSLERAREAFESDPDAVGNLFFDTNFLTALNCAIEEHCCPGMVRLLLAHGADPATLDRWGRTALTALSAVQCDASDTWAEAGGPVECPPGWDAWLGRAARERRASVLQVAAALLDAGADPDTPDGAGRLPAEVAAAAGNHWLERYWTSCREARACAVFRRGGGAPLHQGGALSRLTPNVVEEIMEFLVQAGTGVAGVQGAEQVH